MTTHAPNKTGRTIAVIGGGVLLAWLLWRGRGKGKSSGNDGDGNRDRSRGLDNEPAAVEVWVRSDDRIELDRVSSDLATVIAHARAAGRARVHATGDARQGWFESVIDALRAAGVDVWYSRDRTSKNRNVA